MRSPAADAFRPASTSKPDDTEPLLLDCGATTLIALKRLGIDPASLGWVALSHLHGDHFARLPWLMLDRQFSPSGSNRS